MSQNFSEISNPRTAVILQPSYLPWLGYFAQFHRCDVFIVYDDVQYDKESWRNRNRIKTPQGIQWLTVPVLTKGKNWPSNREVKINNSVKWRKKHLASISQNYSKTPFFNDYIGVFEDIYAREWSALLDLNMVVFNALCQILNLEREVLFASELEIEGESTERLIKICRKVKANIFYEGRAGQNYIDPKLFEDGGIILEYQDYKHPVYSQLHGEFIPYLSIIDLIFNCGSKSLEVLTT